MALTAELHYALTSIPLPRIDAVKGTTSDLSGRSCPLRGFGFREVLSNFQLSHHLVTTVTLLSEWYWTL